VYFNGPKKIYLIFLNLCLARLSNLIWFEYWVFEFKVDWGFISYEVGWVFLYLFYQSGKLLGQQCLSGIDLFVVGMFLLLPKVWRLVFVKLFCWMIYLVFVRVSLPGNLYGAASTI